MPHLIVEYSANLDSRVAIRPVLEAARDAMAASGIFPLGGIRVRAYRADHFVVADGDPRHGFVHATLLLGKGRSEATRREAGEKVFAALRAALAPAFASGPVALQMEMREIDELNWKQNTVHTAVAAKTEAAAEAALART